MGNNATLYMAVLNVPATIVQYKHRFSMRPTNFTATAYNHVSYIVTEDIITQDYTKACDSWIHDMSCRYTHDVDEFRGIMKRELFNHVSDNKAYTKLKCMLPEDIQNTHDFKHLLAFCTNPAYLTFHEIPWKDFRISMTSAMGLGSLSRLECLATEITIELQLIHDAYPIELFEKIHTGTAQ